MSDQDEREVTLPEQLSSKECPGWFCFDGVKLVAFSHSSCSVFWAEDGHGRFLMGIPQPGEAVGRMPVPVGMSAAMQLSLFSPETQGQGKPWFSDEEIMFHTCLRFWSHPGVIFIA